MNARDKALLMDLAARDRVGLFDGGESDEWRKQRDEIFLQLSPSTRETISTHMAAAQHDLPRAIVHVLREAGVRLPEVAPSLRFLAPQNMQAIASLRIAPRDGAWMLTELAFEGERLGVERSLTEQLRDFSQLMDNRDDAWASESARIAYGTPEGSRLAQGVVDRWDGYIVDLARDLLIAEGMNEQSSVAELMTAAGIREEQVG